MVPMPGHCFSGIHAQLRANNQRHGQRVERQPDEEIGQAQGHPS